MIILFIAWVDKCFDIGLSDLICRVQINNLHKNRVLEIESYWSHITHIPLSQFTKTTLISPLHKKIYENPENYHGVLTISVRKSTNLSYLIVGAIDNLRQRGRLMVQ